jgi:hypothetical protein
MSGLSRVLPFAALAAAASLALPSFSGAGAIACQSLNGHVVCAGQRPVTCRTDDGWTTCSAAPDAGHDSSGGEVPRRNPFSVQRFGNNAPGDHDAGVAEDDERIGDATAAAPPFESGSSRQRLRVEQRNAAGDRVLSVERNGHALHLRTGHLDLRVE